MSVEQDGQVGQSGHRWPCAGFYRGNWDVRSDGWHASPGWTCSCSVEHNGLDPAKVQAAHSGDHYCVVNDRGQYGYGWYVAPHQGQPCLPYRLAALALDLQGRLDQEQPQ